MRRATPPSNCLWFMRTGGKEYEHADLTAAHNTEESDDADDSESDYMLDDDEHSYLHVYYPDPIVRFNSSFYQNRVHGYPQNTAQRERAREVFQHEINALEVGKSELERKLESGKADVEDVRSKMPELQREFEEQKVIRKERSKRRKRARDEEGGTSFSVFDLFHCSEDDMFHLFSDPILKLNGLEDNVRKMEERIANFERKMYDMRRRHELDCRPKPKWGREGRKCVKAFLKKDALLKRDAVDSRTSYEQYVRDMGDTVGAASTVHALWFNVYPEEERKAEETYYTNCIWYQKLMRP